MSERKQIYLFANWKMYLDSEESYALARNLLKEHLTDLSPKVTMAVFPSALAMNGVIDVLKDTPISVGAQNIYWVERGGYTGEISAAMYKNVGARYTLIGHSERRHIFKETNHEVRQKLEAALAIDLQPVICVGETLEERERGKSEEVVEIQLRAALENIAWGETCELLIAYEPVWAIGTGVFCDPKETERMHRIIKKLAEALLPNSPLKILYGGSVRPENITDYLEEEHVSGVLVGGSSVKLDTWLQIVNRASLYD
jgi:triosephosphate isomerase